MGFSSIGDSLHEFTEQTHERGGGAGYMGVRAAHAPPYMPRRILYS